MKALELIKTAAALKFLTSKPAGMTSLTPSSKALVPKKSLLGQAKTKYDGLSGAAKMGLNYGGATAAGMLAGHVATKD